jgi:ComF family protein
VSSTGVPIPSNFKEQVRWFYNAALDLLFPPRCAVCRRAGSLLCDACIASFSLVPQPICVICGKPSSTTKPCRECVRISPSFASVRSAFLHDDYIRPAVSALKYKHRKTIAQPLAAAMAQVLSSDFDSSSLLCPVPLHAHRERQRGYNQSELLAQHLSISWCLTLVPRDAVKRSKNTPQQVRLNSTERRENVIGAFYAEPEAVAGCAILLVDDVCTTGATLSACADALLNAGAISVNAVTLARAVVQHQVDNAGLPLRYELNGS